MTALVRMCSCGAPALSFATVGGRPICHGCVKDLPRRGACRAREVLGALERDGFLEVLEEGAA